MENDRILEIDLQIKELKNSRPEVYAWIMLKDEQKVLQEMLSSDDPLKNCDENRKKLLDIEKEMSAMKSNYSSLMLYDALISVRKKIIEKSGDIGEK